MIMLHQHPGTRIEWVVDSVMSADMASDLLKETEADLLGEGWKLHQKWG
ncbi:hypothetical protein [Streptomyces sp. NPDC002644]